MPPFLSAGGASLKTGTTVAIVWITRLTSDPITLYLEWFRQASQRTWIMATFQLTWTLITFDISNFEIISLHWLNQTVHSNDRADEQFWSAFCRPFVFIFPGRSERAQRFALLPGAELSGTALQVITNHAHQKATPFPIWHYYVIKTGQVLSRRVWVSRTCSIQSKPRPPTSAPPLSTIQAGAVVTGVPYRCHILTPSYHETGWLSALCV